MGQGATNTKERKKKKDMRTKNSFLPSPQELSYKRPNEGDAHGTRKKKNDITGGEEKKKKKRRERSGKSGTSPWFS